MLLNGAKYALSYVVYIVNLNHIVTYKGLKFVSAHELYTSVVFYYVRLTIWQPGFDSLGMRRSTKLSGKIDW